MSVSTDLSFAIWNIDDKDAYYSPKMMKRIELEEKPNWIETT